MNAPQSWVEVARLRQGLYRFYSAALLEPLPERTEALVGAAAYLDRLGIEAFAYAMTWADVKEALLAERSVDSLEREYVRLFASGVDGALSPPTESFYAGRADGGGVGTALASLERDYRSLGVTPASAGSVSADHVSTELEVLAFFCAREASAWERDDGVAARGELRHQDRFLRSHLSWWLPEFRKRVTEARAAPFYVAVVKGATAMVWHDCAYVPALLNAGETA